MTEGLSIGTRTVVDGREIVMAGVNTRTAAVTGAGGGLGRDIALGLAPKHSRGFGTAMSPGEIADVQQASGGAVNLTPSDITDDDAVKPSARDVASPPSR